jgi:hypothetical protein
MEGAVPLKLIWRVAVSSGKQLYRTFIFVQTTEKCINAAVFASPLAPIAVHITSKAKERFARNDPRDDGGARRVAPSAAATRRQMRAMLGESAAK